MVKISIKWGKKKFDDVEVDTAMPGAVLKMQVFSLTEVSPERQKLLFKGKAIADDTDLSQLKEGTVLMLMGTAEENALQAPQKQTTVFLEDLPPAMQQVAQSKVPAGLENIGNTCYLNATLQCLRCVPELREALRSFRAPLQGQDQDTSLVTALADLYQNLDTIGPTTNVTFFNMIFRSVHAQFQEADNHGHHKQQDADEAWSALLVSLANKLRLSTPEGRNNNLVDKLFSIHFVSTLKNTETDEEPILIDDFPRKLSCHITIETNFLLEGVQKGLSESITKFSPTLNRDAVFTKTTAAKRLPPWLTVNFIRFFYKAEQNEKAKIRRPVKFPRTLDMIDICTPDVQQALRTKRARLAELRDGKIGSSDAAASTSTDGQPAQAQAQAQDELPDPGFTAVYELKAVLTHIGRTLDGGHYVAWVHKQGDEWLLFDDTSVSPCNYEEDILRLAGGGDWHTAYLCLYQEKRDE